MQVVVVGVRVVEVGIAVVVVADGVAVGNQRVAVLIDDAVDGSQRQASMTVNHKNVSNYRVLSSLV